MASQEDVDMTTETAPKPTTTTNKFTQQRITSRNPQWTYFKLQLYSTPSLLFSLLKIISDISRIPRSHHPIKNFAVDPLTARTYLTSALSQFLGLMGTSIGIDILKIENPSSSSSPTQQQRNKTQSKGEQLSEFPNVWIRVPRDDGAAVLAALSSWVGSLSSSSSASAGAGDSEDGEGGGVAWRVCAKGNYLSAIVHGTREDVFNP
jgi:ribonuclease P/MRP protein subunit POP8